jgi:heme/copper-type cytochrome/quinol oxidase subunit 2
MKNYKHILIKNLPVVSAAIFFTVISLVSVGQVPTNVPSPEAEPVDFLGSTANIVLYVIIPIVIIILFIIWRVRNKNKYSKEDQ